MLNAIDSALERDAADVAAGLVKEHGPYDIVSGANAALEAYDRRAAELHRQFNLIAGKDELRNLGAFVNSLQTISRLLIRTPIALSPVTAAAGVEKAPRFTTDPRRMKYSLKTGAATAAAFVVGLTTHRSDLTVILWTVILAGLPTFGASVRKMILRFIGAAAGGLMALCGNNRYFSKFRDRPYLRARLLLRNVSVRLRRDWRNLDRLCGPAGWRYIPFGIRGLESKHPGVRGFVANVGNISGAGNCRGYIPLNFA